MFRGGGGDGCHLRVVPPGQLHRRPSTPKRACLSAIFIEPGFIYFLCREVSFSCVFCVCFLVVQGFSPRLLCLFSNSFQFKFFIYSLYIHIHIYFLYIFSLYSGFFDLCWMNLSGMSPPDWSSSTYFVHVQICLKYILVYRHWLIYQGCNNLFDGFIVHRSLFFIV